MKRIPLPALLLLAGCHEFEGELGQLGFVSNLITRPEVPWTPAAGIAAEVPVEVAASERLNHESDDPVQVEAGVSGALIALDPVEGHVAFTGEAGDSGRVLFWGEATDRFSVRFSAPASAALFAPDRDTPLDDFAVVRGSAAPLHAEVHDAWGQPLGYAPALLEVGGCASTLSEGGVVTLPGREDCTLQLDLDGRSLYTAFVEVVEPEDIAEVVLTAEQHTTDSGDFLVVSARGWTAAGIEVLGLSPDWSADASLLQTGDAAQVVLPLDGGDPGAVTAHIGGLEAQLRQPVTTSTSSAP